MPEWRDIAGFERLYQVSSEGVVRSLNAQVRHWRGGTLLRRGRVLQPSYNHFGYLQVVLARDGRRYHKIVHRLVAETFLGLTAKGRFVQVNHLNGCKLDNRVENLEVTTAKGNTQHAVRTGLRNTAGTRNVNAKLNDDKVREIRHRLSSGEAANRLAKEYGVAKPQILNIKHMRTWRHVVIPSVPGNLRIVP